MPRRKRRRVHQRPRRVRPADVVLAATLHDPPGALAGDVERLLPRLQALYRSVIVTTSPPTAARVRALVEAVGAHGGTPARNARGPLYRLALRRALAAGPPHVHYLDFDRALHWVRRAPRELAGALRLAERHPVVVLGRTPKAHASHHRPLHATEVLVNRIIARRLGVGGRLDLLVPSFIVGREAAARLAERSRAHDAAMYGEWAALIAGAGAEVAYLECRGLDWETPDRHRAAVRRLGLPAWRRRQDRPPEWALRIDMAAAFVRGFSRTLARWPVERLTLRRLPARLG